MKHHILFLLSLLLLLSLAACKYPPGSGVVTTDTEAETKDIPPSDYAAFADIEQLKYGMTADDVVALLGEPKEIFTAFADFAEISYEVNGQRLVAALYDTDEEKGTDSAAAWRTYVLRDLRLRPADDSNNDSIEFPCDKNGYYALPDAQEREPERFFALSDFDAITVGMSSEEVIALLHSDGLPVGSGYIRFSYLLKDGGSVAIGYREGLVYEIIR